MTIMAHSTGGEEFKQVKRGYLFRQPNNLCVMLDRWIFFGGATHSIAIKSQAHFFLSISGLSLLHPFDGWWLPLVVERRILQSIVPYGRVKSLSQVGRNRWLFPHHALLMHKSCHRLAGRRIVPRQLSTVCQLETWLSLRRQTMNKTSATFP